MEEIKNNSTIHDSKPWFEDEKDNRQPFPTVKYDGYIGEVLCSSYPLIKNTIISLLKT